MTKRTRGFEEVSDKHKEHGKTIIAHGKEITIYPDVQLPARADVGSAEYDFYSPVDMLLLPAQKTIIPTNVKAYMLDDEVLELYPRSSMGIKKGLMLSNTVGIIDSSYYNNESNEGNIGLPLLNTSGRAIEIKKGDRLCQGIFKKYLVADEETVLKDKRTGGTGSSDEQ